MRPIKVEFQAFGPYAGHETVDFEAISERGLFLICGKTGTGKTMILDAMTFALFGKSSGNGRDDFEAMRCTNADFDKTTFVKFEFENNGEYYLFERRLERKRKNLSPSYNLMHKDDDGVWRTVFENAKEKALNEKAVEIIGLDYDQFRQVIVLPQGQFEKLLTSKSDDKEKILTNIFGEERWQKIADQLYYEVESRKNALKEKKDRIYSKLREENCETTAQLQLVIKQKENELTEMEKAFKSEDYDEKIIDLQNQLKLVARFGDLHKAEERVKTLADSKSERKEWEDTAKAAAKAEKIRALLDEADELTEAFESRQKQEKAARDNAVTTKAEHDVAAASLKTHLGQEKTIEDKKTLRTQYEGKRTLYSGIDEAQAVVNKAVKAEKKAKLEEDKAKKGYEAFAPIIKKLEKEYTELNHGHSELLAHYLSGITGELAETLEEGKPCPVCGSTSHPHKATKADNSVSKEEVDAKKEEVDSKYEELNNKLNAQKEAKAQLDAKHLVVEAKHSEVVAAQTNFDNAKKNLVEGIDSLEALETQIQTLTDAIESYAKTKKSLEDDEKLKKEAYTTANAKIAPAEKETKESKAKLEKAEKLVDEVLKKNGFESEDEVRDLLMDEEDLSKLNNKIAKYDADVKSAKESLDALKKELKGKKEPDEAACNAALTVASNAKTDYAEKKGKLTSEVERLSKKSKELEAEGEGIEDKIHEAEEDFVFAKKLRGDSGTGLQRYVLGIMFSSVVAAANKMLEMVHGGRYRLYRSDEKTAGSNKRGLELKVFDKNSEDHEGRFVSTLSGGEKFLASLALSIGMSTIAQKSGIKIEALFIDEGFGSLDEDSITDAMNVLNSIQEANGLVGIISHVQLLQERIPSKLKVEENEKGSHIVQAIG